MKPQLFVGQKPTKEKMQPIKNNQPVVPKPLGGLWTSTYENGTSEWVMWCDEANFHKPNTEQWLLTPRQGLNVLIIDSYSDLVYMMERYTEPFPEIPSLRTFDYESMTKYYDGVHLTSKGQEETRLTHPYSLYGWDCESTIWFSWVFTEVAALKSKP